MNKYNPFLHARFQIYLLQLENYDLKRFFQVSRKSFKNVSGDLRLGITWTSKLRLVVLLAFFLQLIVARVVSLLLPSGSLNGFFVVILFLLSFFIFSFFLITSVFLVGPLDVFLKKRLVAKAKTKLSRLDNVRVIGITGSYGKTTMKDVVSGSLKGSLNVVSTEENKNTPLGISRQILSQVSSSTDVFVVEMGAYTRGDIKELVELVSPEIVILTGINEAHLERQGSIENTIETKFEIVKYAKKGSFVILNKDDVRVSENAERFVRDDQRVSWYSSRESEGNVSISNVSFNTSGLRFHVEELGEVRTQFLPEYIIGNVVAAYLVSQELGVRGGAFKEAVSQVSPPPHRLSLSKAGDLTVIDDSYNGNPDGAQEALKVLSKVEGGRKIYVTPGLVEMGDDTEKVHFELGEKIALVADVVVLVKNSVTSFIVEGLKSKGFDVNSLFIFDSATDAHSGLKGVVQKGDVVLFQNDWPENYI